MNSGPEAGFTDIGYGAPVRDIHGEAYGTKYSWDARGMMRFVHDGGLRIKYFPTLDLALDFMREVCT